MNDNNILDEFHVIRIPAAASVLDLFLQEFFFFAAGFNQ